MIALKIKDSSGNILLQAQNNYDVQMIYEAEYIEGDVLCVECDKENEYIYLQFEDTMPLSFVFLKGTVYELKVPFGEGRTSYCSKSFTGAKHFLRARYACKEEIAAIRDVCLNPYDCHANSTLFPHATANVETRGEAVFAARNAINGNTANHGHGMWPYESWGIQRREDAEFIVEFGRTVTVKCVAITIRCDFPHDNYWHHVVIEFSDGTREIISLEKMSRPQYVEIPSRKATWAKICCMKKDENDASPFPALTAFSVFGS